MSPELPHPATHTLPAPRPLPQFPPPPKHPILASPSQKVSTHSPSPITPPLTPKKGSLLSPNRTSPPPNRPQRARGATYYTSSEGTGQWAPPPPRKSKTVPLVPSPRGPIAGAFIPETCFFAQICGLFYFRGPACRRKPVEDDFLIGDGSRDIVTSSPTYSIGELWRRC